jgi:hypothetical protein
MALFAAARSCITLWISLRCNHESQRETLTRELSRVLLSAATSRTRHYDRESRSNSSASLYAHDDERTVADEADGAETASIFGQLAGAYYGESGIPVEWRSQLAHKELLDRYTELLFQLAT